MEFVIFFILFLIVILAISKLIVSVDEDQKAVQSGEEFIKTFEGSSVRDATKSAQKFANLYNLNILDIQTSETLLTGTVVARFKRR
ncbi:MAG: hypothetical protein LKF42_09710 [Streptococcaceae bacterium]|nr:hypothetical protein [Streptococcaceae bacterium]